MLAQTDENVKPKKESTWKEGRERKTRKEKRKKTTE